MTPEREAEIREWTAQKQHCEFYGSHWLMASDLLAEIDKLRAIPDKDLDGLIDEFMLNGYPLNPDDMKAEMHKHFGPMWAKCNSLMATRDGLWEMYERLLPEYARHTEEEGLREASVSWKKEAHKAQAEVVRLQKEMEIWVGRTNDLQENFDVYYEKYEDLKGAAEPFIHCSAKMVSSTIPGETIIAIEVPLEAILNLRRKLKGS